MKVNVAVKDYRTMTIKQLEKEHQIECQKLLDLINKGASAETINFQKKQVDLVFSQLGLVYKKISNIKG